MWVKWLITITTIVVIMIVLCLYGFKLFKSNELFNFEEPPTLKVSVGNMELPVLKGSYCWTVKSGLLKKRKCQKYPQLLEDAKSEPYTVVQGNRPLVIKFDKQPKKIIVSLYERNKQTSWDITKTGMLLLPLNSKKYIYLIKAEWKEGYADYAVNIEVKK
jgi:hypothetical protein